MRLRGTERVGGATDLVVVEHKLGHGSAHRQGQERGSLVWHGMAWERGGEREGEGEGRTGRRDEMW